MRHEPPNKHPTARQKGTKSERERVSNSCRRTEMHGQRTLQAPPCRYISMLCWGAACRSMGCPAT